MQRHSFPREPGLKLWWGVGGGVIPRQIVQI